MLADRLEHLAELLRHGHHIAFALLNGFGRLHDDFSGVDTGNRFVGAKRDSGESCQGKERKKGAAGKGRHVGGCPYGLKFKQYAGV